MQEIIQDIPKDLPILVNYEDDDAEVSVPVDTGMPAKQSVRGDRLTPNRLRCQRLKCTPNSADGKI